MLNQCFSAQVRVMPRRAACSSKAGVSINRPIIMVITARHRLMSTPFLSAIFTPAAAAFATAQICGSMKQVVTLVGMPREVTTFTTSTLRRWLAP